MLKLGNKLITKRESDKTAIMEISRLSGLGVTVSQIAKHEDVKFNALGVIDPSGLLS
ncbi:MAG: putative aminopeptidase FrvX [Paracoccaceae bacterium]|jgi:putative aminopeptidase FrvX